MDLGIHLPLLQFGDEPTSFALVAGVVDAAVEHGFAAVSANDHVVFQAPWLDGPTALASVVDRSANLTLALTVSLPVLRGPALLAKAVAALDVLSDGRLVAALGPGSSPRDYELAGVDFAERWGRFDEAVPTLRAFLAGGPPPPDPRYYPLPADVKLAPRSPRPGGTPLWIGSWGSAAGLRRVARLADGWLASAYNTTPEQFALARRRLAELLTAYGRPAAGFPNALATMWTWVADDAGEGNRVLADVLAPLLRRDPADLADRVCVGTARHCAEVLSRYAQAGCDRVYLWPLGDERRQLARVAGEVVPLLPR